MLDVTHIKMTNDLAETTSADHSWWGGCGRGCTAISTVSINIFYLLTRRYNFDRNFAKRPCIIFKQNESLFM